MSESVKRFLYSLAIFAALGPPVGGVVFAISTALLGTVTGSVEDPAAKWVLFLFASAFLSYFVALAPAVFAGVLYAFAPPRLRHGVVAFVVGGAMSFATLLIQRPQMLRDLVFGGSYIFAGACAALACGMIADHISRKRAEARTQV